MPEFRTLNPRSEPVSAAELDAVLAARRVLVAVSARSIAASGGEVDLPHFRALVVVASRGPMSLGELAPATGMNLSTASRMCERLVGMGLLNRTDDPANRRQLRLSLTPAGEQMVARATDRRRAAVRPMLEALPTRRRAQLVQLLSEFAGAGGETSQAELWSLGWATSFRSRERRHADERNGGGHRSQRWRRAGECGRVRPPRRHGRAPGPGRDRPRRCGRGGDRGRRAARDDAGRCRRRRTGRGRGRAHRARRSARSTCG